MTQRTVVVTGLGILAPNGIGLEQFWCNTVAGVSGLVPYDWGKRLGFRSGVYGSVKGFDPAGYGIPSRLRARSGRYVQFALAAGAMAMEDAGLRAGEVDPARFGVVIASAIADAGSMEENLLVLTDDGRVPVDAGWAEARFYDHFDFGLAASEVARRFGAMGAVANLSTGCTAGLDALGFALDEIRAGRADVMLAGASEAPLCPLSIGSFEALGALSTRACDDPVTASCPFSADRDGFVIAEGCGLLVLEALDHARARGARIYAELAGYASVNNAYHMTDLPAEGAALARCIGLALDDAGCPAAAIDHIAAHGSSTPQNDVNETSAIKQVFGERARQIPINALKSMTGHALAAANAIEAVAMCLEFRHGLLHPTINYRRPDPACDLDYVPNVARQARIGAAVKLASGFSGIHSAIVMKAA